MDNEWEEVDNLLYLEAWVVETEKEIEVRIAKGLGALNRMENNWKSKIQREPMVRFFRATVESVITYGAEGWTLTKTLEKRLDEVYPMMLRTSLDVPCKRNITNKELYGDLPKFSISLRCHHSGDGGEIFVQRGSLERRKMSLRACF